MKHLNETWRIKRDFSRGQTEEESSRQSKRLREQGVVGELREVQYCWSAKGKGAEGKPHQWVRLSMGQMLLEQLYIDYLD